MTSPVDTFVADLRRWLECGDDSLLVRALRSPYSGVANDTAAAYATLSRRAGPLLDAIARQRIALPIDEREALLTFAERVKSLDPASDIAAVFGLRAPDEPTTRDDDDGEFNLAQAQPPTPRSGVKARQSHFSASALNAFAECPRKWFYRYVCAAVEDEGSSASTYGTAFHSALEDFHAIFPHPEPALEDAMRKRITGDVNWAFERYRDQFDSPVEVELHKRRAQRTAQRYVDWLIHVSSKTPFTVIGREEPANLDIDGFAFVGFIDRVDRDDATGAVTIVDYKTGAIATTAAEYRDKVRTFRDFQLPFYYWARTAAGDRVARLALVPLKDALADVRPIALEVAIAASGDRRRSDSPTGMISIEELERARARMVEICAELTSARIEDFAVAQDPSACTYCAYREACIDRPRDEREKFGR